jgi:hypothetical protein
MQKDAKGKALVEVRRAQSEFEQTQRRLAENGKARRASFEQARKAGATLREIAEAAGLHWSSVSDALRKK